MFSYYREVVDKVQVGIKETVDSASTHKSAKTYTGSFCDSCL